MNIKLIVAYQGTHYLGWQKTPMGPTIEGVLEKAVSQILQHTVKLQAASRTDAGVHAEGQVVNFFTEINLDFKRFQKSLNSLLPKDISILDIKKMPDHFHPTLASQGKVYEYSICLGPVQLPFQRLVSWHVFYSCDLHKMQQGALFLVGQHDFSAFTNQKQANNIREIYTMEIESVNGGLKIRVKGNNFLYKMVRNVVGTLVYVGCGKLSPFDLLDLLASKDRTRAGVTAPAHGLTLKNVLYEPLY